MRLSKIQNQLLFLFFLGLIARGLSYSFANSGGAHGGGTAGEVYAPVPLIRGAHECQNPNSKTIWLERGLNGHFQFELGVESPDPYYYPAYCSLFHEIGSDISGQPIHRNLIRNPTMVEINRPILVDLGTNSDLLNGTLLLFGCDSQKILETKKTSFRTYIYT